MNRSISLPRLAGPLLVALVLTMVLVGALPWLAKADAPFTIKFSGVIDIAPAAAGEPWQVAGYPLTVDANTQIRSPQGPASAGMWADVTAQRLADGSLLALDISARPPEVRLKGPLTAKPDDGIGAWIIAGQTIWCTEETSLSQRSGPVEVGQWVEAHAIEDPAGVLKGVRIRGIETTEDAEIYGAIQSFDAAQWLLSSIPVAAENSIIIGTPQIGLLAQAAAEVTEDGKLAARVYKVLWHAPNDMNQPVQIVGQIEALPENGLLGMWQVAGQNVAVQESTQIYQVKGLVQVGVRVHVTGQQAADHIIATSITVLFDPAGGGRTFSLRGNVEAMPGSGKFGVWTIAGEQVQITRQTRIHGEQFLRVGAPVEAGGLQYQDGTRLLTWLRTRTSGQGPNPSVTPGPSRTPNATPDPSRTPSGTPHSTTTPGPGPKSTPTPKCEGNCR